MSVSMQGGGGLPPIVRQMEQGHFLISLAKKDSGGQV